MNNRHDEDRCVRLALEGERLCKKGSWNSGILHFEEAIKAGTNDLQTLSAVYSQLGNAYFYLHDYQRALMCHRQDLSLAEKMGDKIGEAKAYGNLGNTFKALGEYNEAIKCCNLHLDLARSLGDRVSEGRALYNLGSVYHAKGRKASQNGDSIHGEHGEEIKASLQKAAYFYEENLKLVSGLGEKNALGRACGNLGNIYYLLGNFEVAIKYHKERLKIAEQYGDRQAVRRAYSNLGNSYVFLGKYCKAIELYQKTVQIAKDLNDKTVEAQSYFSLGNIYTLMEDHKEAVVYHQLHLKLCEELRDRSGEARACWSLGNALTSLNQHSAALEYATRHLQLAIQLDDAEGIENAQQNLVEIRKLLGFESKITPRGIRQHLLHQRLATKPRVVSVDRKGNGEEPFQRNSHNRVLLPSVSNRSLEAKMEGKPIRSSSLDDGLDKQSTRRSRHTSPDEGRGSSTSPSPTTSYPPTCTIICTSTENLCGGGDDDDGFFDMLTKSQARRLDDQRCTFVPTDNKKSPSHKGLDNTDELLDILQKLNNRMEEQKGTAMSTLEVPRSGTTSATSSSESLVSSHHVMSSNSMEEQRDSTVQPQEAPHSSTSSATSSSESLVSSTSSAASSTFTQPTTDDEFFDLLMSLQSSRIDDQRTPDPSTIQPAAPSEDFCNMIQHIQSNRINDQRSPFPCK